MTWLAGAHVHDLHPSIGNGPFGRFLGVALHVNVDEHGTPDSFWGNGNPGQVCPNFQVMKSEAAGGIRQMLPLDWQPWCQIDGNFHYAAIETAGLPSEPLTPYQINAIARIVRAYHDQLGMVLAVTDTPGQPGLITHQAGGPAWGGHACPGEIRAGQRAAIITAAKALGTAPAPVPSPEETLSAAEVAQINAHTDAAIKAQLAPVLGGIDHLTRMLNGDGVYDRSQLGKLDEILAKLAAK